MKNTAAALLGLVLAAPGFAADPPASADAQGLEFSASLINDLQRDEGEPIIVIDDDGIIYTCGPTGSSQLQDYAQVSLDGGDQFNILGAPPRGQFSAGGGGDCALATSPVRNDEGFFNLAYSGLSNLVTFTTGTSSDRGASFTISPTSGAPPAVDRQWNVFSDLDTVFMNFNSIEDGGVVVQRSDDAGFSFSLPVLISPNSNYPGPMRSLPPPLNPARNGMPAVYYPWSQGNHVVLAISLDEGDTWNNCIIAETRGNAAAFFPVADHDRAGNVYLVYTDQENWDTYVVGLINATLASCAGGIDGPFEQELPTTQPVQVNRDQVRTTLFPWLAARGAVGRVAVAFYGSELEAAPDSTTDPHVWNVYVTQSLDVFSPAATMAQIKATTHPMHFDQICLNGLACTLGGDRSLADFFAIDLNPVNGELLVVYNRSHKLPDSGGGLTSTPVVLRQIAGPSNSGGTVARNGRSVVRSATSDPEGDAYTDFSGLLIAGTRGTTPALDVTSMEIGPARDASGATLEGGGFTVTIRVKDLSEDALTQALTDVPAQSLLWLFNYTDGYRSHTAQANWNPASGFSYGWNGYTASIQECGTPPTPEPPVEDPAGLDTPEQCIYYPGSTPLEGSVDQATNTIRITVPLTMLTTLKDVPAPARSPAEVPAQPGDRIFSAAVYTLGNPISPVQAVQSWLVPADNTASMDFLVPGGSPVVTPPADKPSGGNGGEGRGVLLGAFGPQALLVLLLAALRHGLNFPAFVRIRGP